MQKQLTNVISEQIKLDSNIVILWYSLYFLYFIVILKIIELSVRFHL